MAISEAAVAHIAGLADPVLRNLRITQSYADLSAAVRESTPGGANWRSFATWASRQAGQTIRHEDFAAFVRARLEQSKTAGAAIAIVCAATGGAASEVLDAVSQALGQTGALRHAGDAVGRGNRKVYEEIGLQFARFAAAFPAAAPPDPARRDAFFAGLRQGPPPDGQTLLAEAFTAYLDARAEPASAARRAQLVLLANLKIGLHEQTRLQPEIAESLNALHIDPAWLADRLAALLNARAGTLGRLWRLLMLRSGAFERGCRLLAEAAGAELRRIATAHFLTLALPRGEALRLGRDVNAAWPASLASFDIPALADLWSRVDRNPQSSAGSGAEDWADLGERMNLIAELFRSRQEQDALLDPPFPPAHVARLERDELPV